MTWTLSSTGKPSSRGTGSGCPVALPSGRMPASLWLAPPRPCTSPGSAACHRIAPSPAGQPLTEFEDAVALDDDGDVAFLAGPLSDDADPSDEGSPGVLVLRGGAVSLLAYPGQVLGTGKVTGVALGPAGGGALAAPSIGPDGTVAFFASLDGNAEVIARTASENVLPTQPGDENVVWSPNGRPLRSEVAENAEG